MTVDREQNGVIKQVDELNWRIRAADAEGQLEEVGKLLARKTRENHLFYNRIEQLEKQVVTAYGIIREQGRIVSNYVQSGRYFEKNWEALNALHERYQSGTELDTFAGGTYSDTNPKQVSEYVGPVEPNPSNFMGYAQPAREAGVHTVPQEESAGILRTPDERRRAND